MRNTKRVIASNRLVTSALAAVFAATFANAADQTWDNGTSDYIWDTSSANWGGSAWSNVGNGAIFGATGLGTINVGSGINLRSLNLSSTGYTLTGGSLNFVNPVGSSSTLGASIIAGSAGGTATINSNINVGAGVVGLLYNGNGTTTTQGGTLVLGGNNTLTGVSTLTTNGLLTANLTIFNSAGPTSLAGTVKLASTGALAPTDTVAIGQGYLDIGSTNRTLGGLTFLNVNPSATWNTTLNANNGVVGSGTLRVNGDINVIGVTGNSQGNTIATNVDLGGGVQKVRIGVTSFFLGQRALMFNGSISNGSFYKTMGYTGAGVFGSSDGVSLHGNNTFTGEAKFNSGTNYITGTNQTTSASIVGIAGPGGSILRLLGANGSLGNADTVSALAAGTLDIDNSASEGTTGTNAPLVAAANNNDRLKDTATVVLRDGTFNYKGFANTASSETVGALNASGGHNVISVTATEAAGSSTLNLGALSMAPRSTLMVGGRRLVGTTSTFGLGATTGAKVYFSSGVPTGVGGILPGIVTNTATSVSTPTDFAVYDPTNGVVAYTGYGSTLAGGGNVSLAAASTMTGNSTVNALKTAGTFTTDLGGNTLNITSGMFLTTGTSTVSNGTLAFGSTPGTLFGSHTISAAITGTDGLIIANSGATLSGNLSGLTGNITHNGTGTLALNTNTFTGGIQVRRGTLSFNGSQTGVGLGAITLGVPGSDTDTLNTVPTLSLTGAGANAVIDRPIIVDNGTKTLGGVDAQFSYVPLLQPLSNATGSQTFNGDITLNSTVNLQGGAGGGTGATNFAGKISGTGKFLSPNGRINFTSTSTIDNMAGFVFGNQGNSSKVNFAGNIIGNTPIQMSGGNSNTLTYNPGSLPTGNLRFWNSTTTTAVSFAPNASATINNSIQIDSNLNVNPSAGVASNWAGTISGAGVLNMNGAGTQNISGNAAGYSGNVTVASGVFLANGTIGTTGPTSSTLDVAAAGTLGGSGTLVRNVTSAGKIAPGNSPGILTVLGNVTFTGGTFDAEILGNVAGVSYDQLSVSGNVALGAGVTTLNLLGMTGSYNVPTDRLVLINNTGSGTTTGTFAGLADNTTVGNWGGSEWRIFYGYNTTTGTFTDGNDVVLAPVPEPASMLVLGIGAAGLLRRRAKRNN